MARSERCGGRTSSDGVERIGVLKDKGVSWKNRVSVIGAAANEEIMLWEVELETAHFGANDGWIVTMLP
jgi:hypothetical protein